MANPFPSGDQADDPLALFGTETESPTAKPATAAKAANGAKPPAQTSASSVRAVPEPVRQDVSLRPVNVAEDASGNVTYPTPSVLRKLAAAVPEATRVGSHDLSVEIIGPPPPGSVSFDAILSVKGLGFVEAIALIQTTCAAVIASGPAAGVPELHGLFLTGSGEVVLHGPPTGEPPAREMARLLHQLVAPNLMPPAGRLFVGRWINSASPTLGEFAAELSYFARPNSNELLTALYSQCDNVRPISQTRPPERRRLERSRENPTRNDAEQAPPSERPSALMMWVRSHRTEVAAAIVILAATAITAVATLLLWTPGTVEASRKPIETSPAADEGTPTDLVVDSSSPRQNTPSEAPGTRPVVGRPSRPAVSANRGPSRPTAPPPIDRRRAASSQPPTTAMQSQDATFDVATQALLPIPLLQSRQTPDLKIYTSLDSGVEPPRLRSAEIPELLIAGFEKRQNRVELVISERGDVQQARMIGPPQRMPDIMLLSRAKELQFDPATRNGIPVRYRLILSWNVTP